VTSILQPDVASRAVVKKLRHAAAVLFGLKFVDNIQYQFKSSKTEFIAKWPFYATCFGVSGKEIRD